MLARGGPVSSQVILLYDPLCRPRRRLMLGDVIELTVVVRDLNAAVARFTGVFGLKVHHRAESKEFGFKNAILPTGIGHIELLQPTDPDKAVGRFLAKHGEGVSRGLRVPRHSGERRTPEEGRGPGRRTPRGRCLGPPA